MTQTSTASEAASQSKINVLILNHSGQISGAEQSMRALLWEFRRAFPHIEPSIGLPGSGPLADLLREEGYNVSFAPLRRVQRPDDFLSGMTILMHVLRTAPFVARLVKQTGAQIIHSNSTTAHLVGGMAAERSSKPAIWHARDLVSLERIAPALAQRAARVIAVSSCVAERLQADGVPEEKIRVIHNGLDPDVWRPRERSQLRQSLGLPDNAFVFGCAGQLVPWKNYGEFIDAAARLCEDEDCSTARFVLVGGDLWGEHQSYVRELRDKVKEHNLQDRFNFVPHQRDNVDALAVFDALVLPSREEPFGRVLIEGMSLGKVVIAHGAYGPLEIISHEHDGMLVPPDAPDGLFETMQRVLGDAGLRAHLQANARQTVIQKFHISDAAERVHELYREVLG